MARLLLVLCATLLLVGCKNDCGAYAYKGVVGTEWCGDVYGTEGRVFENPEAPERSFAELEFRHTVPPGEFDFSHGGAVFVWALWDDIESGDELGPEDVVSSCAWTDYGEPLNDLDDTERAEPAVEVALTGLGGRFNLDVGTSYVRKLDWHVLCGEGEFRLDARDIVEFDRIEGLTPPPEGL